MPIKLSRTIDPVADAPEIKTPIKLAEITLPGPIMRARRVVGHAGLVVAAERPCRRRSNR